MTECINCCATLRKNNQTEICPKCKKDTTVTITFTNARKLYKLTESDIDDGNLYTINVNYHGSPGRKYLIKDIENLAKKIFDQLPNTDKRKIKNLSSLTKKKNLHAINKYISGKYTEPFISQINDLIQQHANGLITYDDATNAIEARYTLFNNKVSFKDLLHKYISEQFSKASLTRLALNDELIDLISDDITLYFKYNNQVGFIHLITASQDYQLFANDDNHINFSEIDIDRSGLIAKLKTVAEQIIFPAVVKLYRREDLIKKLTEHGLTLRHDSKLCTWYLEGGISLVKSNSVGQTIHNLDDIVNIMDEMNFYHTKTNYASINKLLIRRNSHRVEDSDWESDDDDSCYHWELTKPVTEINLKAKIHVLRENRNLNYNDMPVNVKKTYDSIKKK
ncbi:MAG: hypothetical protein Harvfovirus19_15 [Harvfovirus sp.]|uniref:Uncharacterized protein n=1 Tax=Harvfovirus sp. TaxID=2487768 RepID=A0A3G5A218_9VIRU|nr:MAG: hypothetical protein Harvfovirus19_15 [Harvfovirus sp.]